MINISVGNANDELVIGSHPSILLVGAGPTGLTLAIELARRGVSFRLIEAGVGAASGSRGKGLQPRTLEVFEDLGVIDQILESGTLYPRLRIHAGPFWWRGGSLGSSKSATSDVPYPNLWMVAQSKTEEILRKRLEELGSRVEFGVSLIECKEEKNSVRALLSTGEALNVEYLVGCDGGRSVVRKNLGLELKGENLTEKLMLVADVYVEGSEGGDLARRDWRVWPFAKGGGLALCPLPNTKAFQLTGPASMEDCLEETVERVTGFRVPRVDWRSTYRPQVRMVDRFKVGRVFLAGDAAHVHPPNGGQGLNTGVQDAYNLGWKLGAVLNGASKSLLDTYEAERLPIAAAVLGLSKRLHQTRSIKRGEATNQLKLHYRSSPLSKGEATGGETMGDLHPGDRMPDALLDDGTRLFEHMRGCHATIVEMPAGTRIMVRPDGYIASIGREGDNSLRAEYWGIPSRVARIGKSARNQS